MSSFAPQAAANVLSMRLQAATTNLTELEQLVKSGDLDPRVLQEFRASVDLIRGTAWAVQQWIGLKEKSADLYSLLPALSAQRVQRMTQLARDLSVDLESMDVGLETPGLKELYDAISRLHECLTPLCRK
ncbi:MAG TPA: hypothetical protein VLK33_05995 [Terriglobales bacterium]|nr:hypothetical protein [Terriglobales bacterium]